MDGEVFTALTTQIQSSELGIRGRTALWECRPVIVLLLKTSVYRVKDTVWFPSMPYCQKMNRLLVHFTQNITLKWPRLLMLVWMLVWMVVSKCESVTEWPVLERFISRKGMSVGFKWIVQITGLGKMLIFFGVFWFHIKRQSHYSY